MRGHADQIRGRCMRLGMGMRGFGGKRISKRETEPSIKSLRHSLSFRVIGKSYARSGAIMITGKGGTVGEQSQKKNH
jgi:hypothetical protein